MRNFHILLMCVVQACNAAYGFDVQCVFQNANWEDPTGIMYSCPTVNVVITIPNQYVTSVNGQTASSFQGQEVKGFYINSQTVNYAPKGISYFFTNLEGFQIYDSKLKSIEKSDLESFPKLKQINLGFNDLETIPHDLFDFNLELRWIRLYSNKLKAVGHIFEKLVRLEKADFSGNICISNKADSKSELPGLIAELKSKCPLLIPEKVEEKCNCNDIKDLQFQLKAKELENEKLRLQLKSCDGNLDSAIENLFVLSNQERLPAIKEREIDLICKLDDEETCETVDLKVKFPDSSIAKVVDQSGEIIDTDQIKKLTIRQQQTLFLPNNLAQIFPQLTELSVIDSGLFDIESKTFSGMYGLKTLTLNSNKITKIPSEAFKDLKSLVKLDLAMNKLRTVNDGAFKSLKQLQELNLNINVMTKINAKVFEGLESLKILQLQNNKLKFVNVNLFKQLPALLSADFKENECINATFPEVSKDEISAIIKDQCSEPLEIRCEFVEYETSSQDPRFKMTPTGYVCNALDLTIEIPKTKVFKITGDHLDDFDNINVTAFKAITQTIHFIPHELFKHFPNIIKIIIESSKLSSLKKNDFEGIADLKILSLRNNELTTIDVGTFDDNELLEYLNLAHNKIDSLPSQIFVKLTQLKFLILSHNQLTTLPGDILSEQNSIEEFNVAYNQLTKIFPKTVAVLENAKIINFATNSCIDVMYEESKKNGKTVADLLLKIVMKCS